LGPGEKEGTSSFFFYFLMDWCAPLLEGGSFCPGRSFFFHWPGVPFLFGRCPSFVFGAREGLHFFIHGVEGFLFFFLGGFSPSSVELFLGGSCFLSGCASSFFNMERGFLPFSFFFFDCLLSWCRLFSLVGRRIFWEGGAALFFLLRIFDSPPFQIVRNKSLPPLLIRSRSFLY